MPRLFDLGPIRTLAAAAVAGIVIIVVSLPLLSIRIDNQTRRREASFVAASISRETDVLRNQIGSTANWDPSIRNLDNSFDMTWAQSELTSTNDRDVSSRVVAVFDAGDAVLFARSHSAPMPAGAVEALRQATRGVVGRIRQLEAARNASPRHRAGTAGTARPDDWIEASSTVLLSGRPCLIVASLIGSDTGTQHLVHARAPIFLLASDLQATIIPQINRRLRLTDAVLTRSATGSSRGSYDFLDDAGGVVAVFSWVPDHLGTRLLDAALLPMSIVVGALLSAVLLAYRQSLQGTRLLVASETRATMLSLRDDLTGLPNRKQMTERLAQALSTSGQPSGEICVLLLNIDQFKQINDSYGHQGGDELIREVGRRLGQSCGHGETCGRFGGNEFLVILPAGCDPDAASACDLAQRLLDCVAEPMELTAGTVRATASIGISVSRPNCRRVGELLRQADLALMKARAAGGGARQLFDVEMDAARSRRRAMERDLRDDLAAGKLEIAYQPQFDGERMIGVEALARWTHQTLGPVSPAVFAPLAEECGLIAALGLTIMRKAFTDSRRWPELRIAINVSARQLQMPDFVDSVRELVGEFTIDPRRFELEITEGVLVANNTEMRNTLQSLHGMGFSIALDDFGTGYSSLSYLARFPIDKIKIDRSFVSRLPDDRQAYLIIRAIVQLAQALEMHVIAEGVETVAQEEMLARAGCTQTQGYLRGRPMPADQVVPGMTFTIDAATAA